MNQEITPPLRVSPSCYSIIASLILLCISVNAFAQKDSIFISIRLEPNSHNLHIEQKIIYHNSLERPVDSIKLLSWANAYRHGKTPLGIRKLEERKTNLYFAQKEELGEIENLEVDREAISYVSNSKRENIFLTLRKSLPIDGSLTLRLSYDIQLPNSKITRYGYSKDYLSLKYFFIVPDGFEDNHLTEKYFLDIEDNQSAGNYWDIQFEEPAYFVNTNLPEVDAFHYAGVIYEDPEIIISQRRPQNIQTTVDGDPVIVDFGYRVPEEDLDLLQFYLPLQLKFIKEHIGYLPHRILLTERDRKKNGFLGSDDIKIKKWTFKFFEAPERVDLNYFSMISQAVVEQSFMADKNAYHWLYNGLQTYLEMSYVEEHYPEEKLAGLLPEQIRIGKIKPLKWFNASKLKLTDRYALGYAFILGRNLDQKIDTPFTDLSKYNIMAVSHFETGILFNFVAQKIGPARFNEFVRNYFEKNRDEEIDGEDFLRELLTQTEPSTAFLQSFIQRRNRVNFKLQSKREDDDGTLQLRVKKNTRLAIPYRLRVENKDGNFTYLWKDTDDHSFSSAGLIKRDTVKQISLNTRYLFPETSYKDNHLYTKGTMARMKKIKFRLITDIPNPEFMEIYWFPQILWNNYDKFQPGITLHNRSLIPSKFLYKIEPFYSTGTKQLVGEAGLSYTLQPAEAFFRKWTFGGDIAYFHYDKNLPYRSIDLFTNLNFRKGFRSQVDRNLRFSYSYFARHLREDAPETDYGQYHLWSLGYSFVDKKAIFEKSFRATAQWMEDFQKISAEYFYRWEYAHRKKLMVRFFGGYFVNNHTRNDLFDLGVSDVSNYAFNYGLLGQSDTHGIWNQQFIMAEGAFKSNFGTRANQWVVSMNTDLSVWKMLGVYGDIGAYKNKGHGAQFIWDSGVKLSVIPDFLEIYFPVQSSNGFEFKNKYSSKIRFTFNLHLSAIYDQLRRGFF